MDKIALQILTGDGPVFDRMVEYVNIPTGFGPVGVLAGHAQMLCAVEAGLLRCRWSDGAARVRVGSGVASVEKDVVTLLVTEGKVLED